MSRCSTTFQRANDAHIGRVCKIISETTSAEDEVWIAQAPRLVQESTLAIEIRRAERKYSESMIGQEVRRHYDAAVEQTKQIGSQLDELSYRKARAKS